MTPVLVPFLLPFAGLYWIALRFDRWRRGSHAKSLSRPVISVGNLTVGGTGKTPLLIYLTNHFIARSLKTAVLTRGYRGVGRRAASNEQASDETVLLKKRCPGVVVGVGADRWQAAQDILAEEPVNVFLLDDGFQHWPLKRNFDVVCIDATDPWGGGWLLPAGRLREPRRALHRANAVVVNRMELVSFDRRKAIINDIESCAVGIPTFVSQSEYRLIECASQTPGLTEVLNGRAVIALSGIGNPRAFEETLTRMNARVLPARFADHHAYTAADVARVREAAAASRAIVVMTEKDWVKIEPLVSDKTGLYVLRMDLAFSIDEQHRLHALLAGALA